MYKSISQQHLFPGDDQHSAAAGALQSRPGTDFFERSCQSSQIPSAEETENLIIDSGTTLGSTQTASQARRCTFGRLEYEKTTGYELIR